MKMQNKKKRIKLVLKVNPDAAFDLSSGATSLGAVIRDSSGKVLVSASLKLARTESPLHAEVRALLFELSLARERGCNKLLVETDSFIDGCEASKNW